MSGLWRDLANDDIGGVYHNEYGLYPKDHIRGVYKCAGYWLLRFESGWQIGKFDTVEDALNYAMERYREHIRMV